VIKVPFCYNYGAGMRTEESFCREVVNGFLIN